MPATIRLSIFILAAACTLPWRSAGAADPAQDIEARYRNEIAACEQAPASEDRSACRRDAAAARAEARHGTLASAPEKNLERNALARCEALPEADRDLCRRRTRGEGVTKGSVAEGGIYREYREAILPEVTPREGVAPAEPSGGQPGAAQGR